ncbi:peptide-methionine (S)-S-oxide reductase [Halomonas binhaiensis]|uniref:peptide-methionine (S)-S-oxide reductase n=1 Tax=Halomonas binhaiensis TaxID=2562282 RepID=A0A5C1NGC8_9GAMM|nr:peptide-methionine (S)-S-oxide reductase [Halomonas binhaiensis]QEM82742.1 peptide-methionine (S)-S-oxide reductase [Halomonas binhaiensis]
MISDAYHDEASAVALSRVAFGGNCYWCTEAVFQSLLGVEKVEQGFVAAQGGSDHDVDSDHDGEAEAFSEAVIVHFDPMAISLATLVEIHLHTHHCTAQHSMRQQFRSAVYVFDEQQDIEARYILNELQADFSAPLITQVLPFASFRPSKERCQNYFYSNPQRPFCERWITPKLRILLDRFSQQADQQRLANAGLEIDKD